MHDGSVGVALPPPVEIGARLHSPPLQATHLAGSQRIAGYDAARAVAIIGMIVVNSRQIFLAGSKGPAWFVGPADFLYGRPAVLFVVLAGIGLSLMSRSAVSSGLPEKLAKVRFLLFRRSLVLFVMGMIFRLWWRADILHFYGLFLSAATLLLTVPTEKLWGLIGVLLVSGGLVFLGLNDTLPSLEGWLAGNGLLGMSVDDLILDGSYPLLPWFGFLLFGLWYGRLMISGDKRINRNLLKTALYCFAGAELLGRLGPMILFRSLGFKEEGILEMLFMLNPFPMTPLFAISATAGAVLILGSIMAMPIDILPPPIWRILQNTGKLSLTIYIGHILFFLWLYSWMPDKIDRDHYPLIVVMLVPVFCILITLGADFWARRYGRGPLERLMRK